MSFRVPSEVEGRGIRFFILASGQGFSPAERLWRRIISSLPSAGEEPEAKRLCGILPDYAIDL